MAGAAAAETAAAAAEGLIAKTSRTKSSLDVLPDAACAASSLATSAAADSGRAGGGAVASPTPPLEPLGDDLFAAVAELLKLDD